MSSLSNNDFALSIIIPAYNEKNSLRNNVKCALQMNDKIIHEVIIIVSLYADPETLKVCQELSQLNPKVSYHIQKRNTGLGYALREGFALARGTHVQILYADCESDPERIVDFVKKAHNTNADMVIASRYLEHENIVNCPWIHYFFNRTYQKIFRILFRTKLHDLTFGYNLIRIDIIRTILWQSSKHEIATEMVLKALKMNYHIEEIPVIWKRRDEGKSTLNPIRYIYYPLMALFILLCPRKYFYTANSKNS